MELSVYLIYGHECWVVTERTRSWLQPLEVKHYLLKYFRGMSQTVSVSKIQMLHAIAETYKSRVSFFFKCMNKASFQCVQITSEQRDAVWLAAQFEAHFSLDGRLSEPILWWIRQSLS